MCTLLSRGALGGRLLAREAFAQDNDPVGCQSDHQELVALLGLSKASSLQACMTRRRPYMRYQYRTSNSPPLTAPLNMEFSAYNPVLDGVARGRELEIIDGGLLNGDRLIIIFRERFKNFIPGSDEELYAYGVIDLGKEAADLEGDYRANLFCARGDKGSARPPPRPPQ